MSYGIGSHHQLKAIQTGQQVLWNILVPCLLYLLLTLTLVLGSEIIIYLQNGLTQECSCTCCGIEYLNRRHFTALTTFLTLNLYHNVFCFFRCQTVDKPELRFQNTVNRPDNEIDNRLRCIVNAPLHLLCLVICG